MKHAFIAPLLAALAFMATASPASAQTREPEQIVKSLYEAAMKGKQGAAFGLNPGDRRLLTKSLKTLWDKADKKTNPKGDEVGAIDFDMVTMSQDPDIASYQLKTQNSDDQHATVTATFVIGPSRVDKGQKVVVNYDFLRESGVWKIDNVRSSIDKKPWTLRENLQINLRNR
jgi:uncharacterized protein DUF3828